MSRFLCHSLHEVCRKPIWQRTVCPMLCHVLISPVLQTHAIKLIRILMSSTRFDRTVDVIKLTKQRRDVDKGVFAAFYRCLLQVSFGHHKGGNPSRTCSTSPGEYPCSYIYIMHRYRCMWQEQQPISQETLLYPFRWATASKQFWIQKLLKSKGDIFCPFIVLLYILGDLKQHSIVQSRIVHTSSLSGHIKHF